MAQFGTVQLPDWTKTNDLFDNAKIQGDQLRNQLANEQIRKMGLENQFTETMQPLQMNALLQAVGPMGGGAVSPSTASGPSDTNNAMVGDAGNGLTVTPVAPGQSLLAGETPQAQDTAAQQRVGEFAQAAGVNPEWAKRVAYAESGSYPDSMSAVSHAGAIGTMQLMPDTAAQLRVDPRHPEQNARGGVEYLRQMKEQFGDPIIATAAYNAGPARVSDWLAGKGTLPTETVNYVGKVFGGNGIGLLNNAIAGSHGHPIGGAQVQQSGGLQSVQMDDAARNSVRQLIALRNAAMLNKDGRAAVGYQNALDNITKMGAVVDPVTGNVYRVPGAFSSQFSAANAAAAGKVGPEAALHSNNATLDQRLAVEKARQEAQIKIDEARRTPTQVAVGHTLTTPEAQIAPASPLPGLQPSSMPVQPAPQPQQVAPSQDAASPNTYRPTENIDPKIYGEDREALTKVSDELLNGQAAMAKVLEQRNLLQGLPTGSGGDVRAKWANAAETYLPPDLAAKFKQTLSLPDAVPAQEYAKLALQNAGTQERQVLGGRGGFRAIQMYRDASPSLELQPTANRDIHNLQLVAMQADQDYGQGLQQWVNTHGQTLRETGKGYRPASEFDQQWVSQRNPQVYVAAASAMNGKPFADWSKGLKPDEMERAMQIIGRIDPTTQVPGRNGHPLPVSGFLTSAR